MRYIQNQQDKYDDGEDIYEKKLTTLSLIEYKNLYTKDKWLVKSPEEEQILALSSKLDNLNARNFKLEKYFKS